jgi:hypothetical protein
MAASSKQNILRLHIAMNYSLIVCCLERIRDLPGEFQRLSEWKPAFSREAATQRFAVHEGHDEEERATRLAGIVQRKNEWMA